jgi:parvulin-like peptidyl-prolyl isomerase
LIGRVKAWRLVEGYAVKVSLSMLRVCGTGMAGIRCGRPVALASLLLAFLFALSSSTALAGSGDPVVRVDETVFTESDLGDVLSKIVPSIIMHKTISPERMVVYRPKAVDRLIEDELFYREALRMGLEVEKKRLKAAMKNLMKKLGGKKRLRAILKTRGLTIKDYEKILERSFLIEMIVSQEITRKASVSEEEARGYYEENKGMYMRPEAWRVSHILISVAPSALSEERENMRKRAGHVLKEAARGLDFATLAWDYSDDAYKYVGGDLGLLHKGRLDPALEEEIAKLKVGEISGVIETIYGYHIVKLIEEKEPTQLEFEEVSQKIIMDTTESNKKKLREKLVSRLREKADIEIY